MDLEISNSSNSPEKPVEAGLASGAVGAAAASGATAASPPSVAGVFRAGSPDSTLATGSPSRYTVIFGLLAATAR